MALIIDLKPSEKIIIGEALITNDKSRTRLHIEGDAPILREKDILRPDEADSPGKRIYVLLQLMYLAHEPKDYHEDYFKAVRELQDAAPSTSVIFMKINDYIIEGRYYKALKEARSLIDYEVELLKHATA
jgi:flagellar protein FlbT